MGGYGNITVYKISDDYEGGNQPQGNSVDQDTADKMNILLQKVTERYSSQEYLDKLEKEREHRQYLEMMQEVYGFSVYDAEQLEYAYKKFDEHMGHLYDNSYLGNRRKIKDFYSKLASLHDGYSFNSKMFFLMGNNLSRPKDAINFFYSIGVDGAKLSTIINSQHSNCKENCKRDFAHECATMYVMGNYSVAKTTAESYDDVDALVGYKGDIYSGSMGIDDIRSDIAAYNIYKRMIGSEDGNIWSALVDYNEEACAGTINESREFLNNFYIGNPEKGMEILKEEIDKTSIGTKVIVANGGSEMDREQAKENFLTHISDESGIDWK